MKKRYLIALVVLALVLVLGGILAWRAGRQQATAEPLEPLANLDIARDRAARALAAYVRFDTSAPTGIPAEPTPPFIEHLLASYVRPLGLDHEILAQRSLMVRWRAQDNPAQKPKPKTAPKTAPNPEQDTERPDGAAVFLSHADVVPVADDERARWTHAPFAGIIADGYVWGRGALDNKASTICAFEAIAALQARGLGPRRDIIILVVPDEEIGGAEGIGRVLRDHRAALGNLAVVFDEGSFVIPDFLPGTNIAAVAVGEKHYVTITVTVEGEPGHSSSPSPDDPPTVLAQALGRLVAYQHPARLLPPVELFLDRVSDRMPFGQRLALKNRWLFGSVVEQTLAAEPGANAMIRDTMALTMLRAGIVDNVIPARAQATINLRLLPGSSLDSVLQRIAEVLDEPRAKIESIDDLGPVPLAPIAGPLWTGLESVLATAIPGVIVAPIITPGTVDGRYFARLGIPTYRMLPFTLEASERARMHGIDERIAIDALEQGIRVYAHLMHYY